MEGLLWRIKKTVIYNCAKEVFSAKGFKDTNISEITKQAGMAVGTFYNYYPSKEKLFMDIFLEENTRLKHECFQALDLSQDPLVVVEEMQKLNVEGIKTSPILREWYNKSVLKKYNRFTTKKTVLIQLDFYMTASMSLLRYGRLRGRCEKI